MLDCFYCMSKKKKEDKIESKQKYDLLHLYIFTI